MTLPIAIVNQTFARRYFEGHDPVGQTFEMMEDKKKVRFEIVEYAADARYRNLRESIRPTVYVPLGTKIKAIDWATFVVRTTNADPLALASILRREVHRARSEFRVMNVHMQTELVDLESLLYAVKGTDLAMVGLPMLTISMAALLAAFVPAIQAVRIDPAVMLRVE